MKSLLFFVISMFVFVFDASLQNLDSLDMQLEQIEPDLEEVDLFTFAGMRTEFISFNDHHLHLLVKEKIISGNTFNRIKRHQSIYGNILCLEELQVCIDDLEIIRQLGKFCFFPTDDLRIRSDEHRLTYLTRFATTLESKKGFSTKKYRPTPWNQLHKLKFVLSDKLQVGCTFENDAGEPLLSGINKYGFDFQSLYLLYREPIDNFELILGDFGMRTGQGLTLNTAYSAGETLESHSLVKPASLLKPYTSANEMNLLRGVALKKQFNRYKMFLFGSYLGRDFTLQEDEKFFSSFSATGLHRTQHEQSKKFQIKEGVAGSYIQYNLPHLTLGSTVTKYWFSHHFKNKKMPWTNQSSTVNTITKLGLDLLAEHNNQTYFAELATDDLHFSLNYIGGIVIALSRKISIGLSLIGYSHNFFNYQSNAIGNSSSIANDRSFIAKTSFEFVPFKILLNFKTSYAPFIEKLQNIYDQQIKQTVQVEKIKRKVYECYVRIQRILINQFQMTRVSRQLKFRIQLRTHLSRNLMLTYRVETNQIRQFKTTNGLLAYMEINSKLPTKRVQLKARICAFQTDDYPARIWSYESSVPMLFESPSFYDKGIRWYTIVNISSIRRAKLSFKFARTAWLGKTSIGSGNDEIPGNSKHTLTLQAQYKW